ncbi:MAG: carboxypeptidase-like regulatory domain-containing protein [Terracidiphilus sp.]
MKKHISNLIRVVLVVAPLCIGASHLMARSPSGPSESSVATLRGHIVDPTGALIPGAEIIATSPSRSAAARTVSSPAGGYVFSDLLPGEYVVQASAPGFTTFVSSPIYLLPGDVKEVNITMTVEGKKESVTVDDSSSAVSVEADRNASALVFSREDLNAFSDDPDELAKEIAALAGPTSGPSGGQIFIDGFTGGTLPPKTAIREVRINQDPFSAEFDRPGYGRTEILTQPGADSLHGQFLIQGNDDAFNTTTPFASEVPSYHSIQYNATATAAINKRASVFVSYEQRNNEDSSIYNVATAVLDPSTNLFSPASVSGGLYNPQTYTGVSSRLDLRLGGKDTGSVRYQYHRTVESGAIGATSLPSQASTNTSTEQVLQFVDAHVISDRLVNETRFQYMRDLSSSVPLSISPVVTVPQDFVSGGALSQHLNDHQDHFELHNLSTMVLGTHGIKFGLRLRDNREAVFNDANFNGSFEFPSVDAYSATLNGLAAGESIGSIAASCPFTQAGGCVPNRLTYSTGSKQFVANTFDAALFIQDDWKVNKKVTLSGGLRWESQNHIPDHSDWAPRLAIAYALDGHRSGEQVRTVLRAGFGIFYDRLGLANIMDAGRFNGGVGSQKQVTFSYPTCFNTVSLAQIENFPSVCGSTGEATSTIVQIAPRYHSPYTEQFGANIERQLTKSSALTITYLHSYGVHQLVMRDANAFLPGTFAYDSSTQTGVRPNPSLGIVNEYDPEAMFRLNKLVTKVSAHISPRFSLTGVYGRIWAESNLGTGTASDSYNLNRDLGRDDVQHHMFILLANYTGPWKVTFNPLLFAQAGKPFNIVTANDLTGDSFFNNRPSYAGMLECATSSTRYVLTSYGCFDTEPGPTDTPIPINLGNGPTAVTLNLRASRAFELTHSSEARADHGSETKKEGRKYFLTFSVQAMNLFNNVNYGAPVGNVSSSRFGRSTSLAGGAFSSESAPRRAFIQAVFSF